MTSSAVARLRAAERKLSEAPPARLDGQTAIRLSWHQDALWGEGAAAGAAPRPAETAGGRSRRQRQPKDRPAARRRRRRHSFDHPARPVTRPRRDYTTGRRLTTVPLVGDYL
ncbi:hypothetical protein [Streptomyces sp. DH12]|uniref:hypothetical protein n=1 Tax=Streptomyces sp. DH12 TaxID=2857010 RepID=UPI001E5FD44E|nr:hypothetical protein [Streptomyces sp. DH12]